MKFDDWLDEMEGFGYRFERLLCDFPELRGDKIDRLKKWLKAAYEVGYEHAADEAAEHDAGESL